MQFAHRHISFDLHQLTAKYISRMTTKPSVDHIRAINQFVCKTKSILLNKADVMYLGNINNSNDSFINLVKDSHHGTIQGSGLTFEPYWGFSNPDGSAYVDTNYNPRTQAVNYSLNDCGIGGYYINDTTTTDLRAVMSYDGTNYSGMSGITNYLNKIANSISYTLPFRNGFRCIRRTAYQEVAYTNQNIVTGTNTGVSNSIPNNNFILFRLNSSDNTTQYLGGLNLVYIGASLTDSEYAILNNAYNDYLIQCLFLKYGDDNWGVQMAKSYFLELHNFEKYEAWEVYEFIRRHQSDHVNTINQISVNSGTDGMTDWVDSDSDGWADGWSSYDTSTYATIGSIVTGNGFTGNAQRGEKGTGPRPSIMCAGGASGYVGMSYYITFKYRASKSFRILLGGYAATSTDIPSNTGNAIDVSINITPANGNGGKFWFSDISGTAVSGDYIELDEVSIKPNTVTGYLYNTFGPGSSSTKTVADYIALLKCGGNVASVAQTKSGSMLRWDQDGILSIINSMPAYSKGSNLGIITVSSSDGFNGWTQFDIRQSAITPPNMFYGNIPMFEKVKSSRTYMLISNNRSRVDLRNANLSGGILAQNLSSTIGYLKLNLDRFVGSTVGGYFRFYSFASTSSVTGDLSLWTTEFTSNQGWQVYGTSAQRLDGVIGTLQNFVINNNNKGIFNMQNLGITAGFSSWNKNVPALLLTGCRFSTADVDNQLSVINNYFASVTPIKNLTLTLDGSTMGIPTGGANNTDLLGIVAKHTAAGFSASITVRTV